MTFHSAHTNTERCSLLFHLPKDMFEKCFSDKDLHRLDACFEWHAPASNDPEELLSDWEDRISEVQVVVTGWDSPPITESMLAAADRLEVILHSAGSIRPFIPESVWDSDIRIATCNDALGQGVAETTLGLIISGLKGFFPCAALTRNGAWQGAIPPRGFGRVRELFDVTIGIIGASRTGRHVLRLLKNFDAEIVISDPTLGPSEARFLDARLVDLETLMRTSDIVSLHAPALPQLRGMLGMREFALMKDDAIFINTARGMLIDEDALIRELQTGRISAILDVTSPEPPAPGHPFRSLPNVILLPHIAGAITNGCLRQGHSAIDQLMDYAVGKTMSGEITREQFAFRA